jgi:hypothetical protein
MKKFTPKPRPFKYRAVTVEVRRDELTTFQMTVAPWEYPLIEAQFAEITVKNPDAELAFAEPIDAQTEFERLAQRYKHVSEGGDPGVPLVARVYGQHSSGLRTLAKEIEAAAIGPEDNDPAPAAAKPRKAKSDAGLGAMLGAA